MTHHHFFTALLLAGVAGPLAGCTIETTEKYVGDPFTRDADWTSGQNLDVTGLNGQIEVVRGEEGVVRATFEPFTFRGSDEASEAKNEMENILVAEVVDNGDSIIVRTNRESGGSSSLGALITIEIPPDFDAGIYVEQGNGDAEVNFVGEAAEVRIDNDGSGECYVYGAPSVRNTVVSCSGSTLVRNVSDRVDIETTGIEAVANIELVSIDPDAGNSRIYTEDGDIVLALPNDANFWIWALVASPEGQVNTGPVPDDCSEEEAEARSKSVFCGGEDEGPEFDLQAGLDPLDDEVNIELKYQ